MIDSRVIFKRTKLMVFFFCFYNLHNVLKNNLRSDSITFMNILRNKAIFTKLIMKLFSN